MIKTYLTFRKVFLILIFFIQTFLYSLSLVAENLHSFDLRFPVEKFKLKNGLTVLLHEDHTIPMVSYHTWYKVGSRDEMPGVTGAAHMLEHMMFKGAKKYTGKQFDEILHENGITNNAFTTTDYTGFYENLPSSKLELIMDVEVDRMRDLAITEKELKSELQVVGEERRWRVDNSPTSLLRERLMENLYEKHPYRWPTIGYMKDIEAYTPEKLRHFYETYYVPNNAVLVIAGDIDIKKTKSLIEKYYSNLKEKPLPERKYPKETELKIEKRFSFDSEVQNETLIIAYPGVKTGHADSFALDLLANIMGAGSSSRLHRKLVYENQKASSATGYNSTSADAGYFVLMASMKPGFPSNDTEVLLEQEALRVQKENVSERELRKAKNQIMKEFVEELSTLEGKAESLATNELIQGGYQNLFEDLNEYQKVSVEDIRRVANQYLKSTSRVVGTLLPKVKGK